MIAVLAGDLSSGATVASTAAILLLILAAAAALRASRRLDEIQRAEQQQEWSRRAGKWFGITFAAEGLAIGVGSGIAAATGNVDWIPPVIAAIVGLHFFPLGHILGISADYWLGKATIGGTALSPG